MVGAAAAAVNLAAQVWFVLVGRGWAAEDRRVPHRPTCHHHPRRPTRHSGHFTTGTGTAAISWPPPPSHPPSRPPPFPPTSVAVRKQRHLQRHSKSVLCGGCCVRGVGWVAVVSTTGQQWLRRPRQWGWRMRMPTAPSSLQVVCHVCRHEDVAVHQHWDPESFHHRPDRRQPRRLRVAAVGDVAGVDSQGGGASGLNPSGQLDCGRGRLEQPNLRAQSNTSARGKDFQQQAQAGAPYCSLGCTPCR